MRIGHVSSTAFVLAIAAFALSAGAADSGASDAIPTREVRNRMAVLHDKAAACLRSDRPLAECRSEMMEGCRSIGAYGCPMMDMKMEHQGRRPSDKSTEASGSKER